MLVADNFTYGLLTPAVAYVMSCMGAFLGLRCTARARSFQGAARARWLLLGGLSIATTGIWLMHFIAMLGFTIRGETITYNVPITILSLLVAVVIVCAGLMIVGFSRDGLRPLLIGGVLTGIGVAAMHYLGMLAMRMPGRVSYNMLVVAVSLVIAIVAATASLWAARYLRGVGPTLIAAMIMGIAVSGMHYTGMLGMHIFSPGSSAGMAMGTTGGATAESFLLPLILGISVISFMLTATIVLSPTADEMRYNATLIDHISKHSHSRSTRA